MFCQADHHPKLQLPGSKAFASTSKRSMQASGSGMLFYDHWGKGSNINEVSKSSFPSRWISLEDNFVSSNIQRGVTGMQNLFHYLLFSVPVEI